MKRIVLCLTTLALNAGSTSDSPYLTGQIGIIRGASNPYTDSKFGPQIGLAWTFPVTKRQGLRGWSDFAQIQGNSDVYLQVYNPYSQFPWDMVPGKGEWKQQSVTLGIDYRITFLKSNSSPYFFVGPIVGRIRAEQKFVGGYYAMQWSDTLTKTGVSWGFGMQFSNKIDFELRIRNYNGFNNGGFYNLTVGYHF